VFTLVLVARERAFIFCQVRKKAESPDAVGGDFFAVNRNRPIDELAQIFPVEVEAMLKLPYQALGIESVARLP
jgi:hypothetical protein